KRRVILNWSPIEPVEKTEQFEEAKMRNYKIAGIVGSLRKDSFYSKFGASMVRRAPKSPLMAAE
ncbi:MAG: hypothetical protein ABJA10_04275, partial [Aestuariivirga sp.]